MDLPTGRLDGLLRRNFFFDHLYLQLNTMAVWSTTQTQDIRWMSLYIWCCTIHFRTTLKFPSKGAPVTLSLSKNALCKNSEQPPPKFPLIFRQISPRPVIREHPPAGRYPERENAKTPPCDLIEIERWYSVAGYCGKQRDDALWPELGMFV